MAVGHATGTAAAMSASSGTQPRKLDVQQLRVALQQQEAIV
jgi:hypothetical protein